MSRESESSCILNLTGMERHSGMEEVVKELLEKAGLENNPANRELLFRAAKEVLSKSLKPVEEPLWLRTLTNNKRKHKPLKKHLNSSEVWEKLKERVKEGDKNFESRVIKLLLSY